MNRVFSISIKESRKEHTRVCEFFKNKSAKTGKSFSSYVMDALILLEKTKYDNQG